MRFCLTALAALSMMTCGDPPPTDGKAEGRLLGVTLAEHIPASLKLEAPYRCARLPTEIEAPAISDLRVSREGIVLTIEDSGRRKRGSMWAAVADARGADEETLAGLESLRRSLVEEKVDVVLSLGGMATEAEEIKAVLEALSRDTSYLLIALPGDRESLPDHRQAVRELADAGARILDGSRYRFVKLHNVLLATMPGISMSANLVAQNRGCQHDARDVAALLDLAAEQPEPTLLASYAPIRGLGGDLGLGGIHVGERALAPLGASGSIAASVHGMVASPMPAAGRTRRGTAPLSLPAGSLDPLEGKSDALLLRMVGKRLRWRHIQAD